MKKIKVTSSLVRDYYYKVEHKTGLKIFIYPKEKFRNTYAIFGTRYGSVDNCFKRSDEEQAQSVPEGIAHFLEHKLFESEGEDAFERYAKVGANANAYTSFERTCYLFSCTDHFYRAFEILLDFVQDPYFTAETVQKEQGIIGQEIKMYEDDPQWQVAISYLRAMYHNHCVRDDIAGTVESISQITPELLYRCYNTFYNLNNMALCIVGDVDSEKILDICDKLLKPCAPVSIEKIIPQEPEEIVKSYTEKRLSVALPLFQFGYKEKMSGKLLTERDIAAVEVLLDIIASDSSPLFKELLDEGLINESSFGYEYFEGAQFATPIFYGESSNPKRVSEKIAAYVERLKLEGISKKDFERSKRSIYGNNISALNSTSAIANAVLSLTLSDREFFTYLNCITLLTVQEVQQKLEDIFDRDCAVLSAVMPL